MAKRRHHIMLRMMMNIPFFGLFVRIMYKRKYPALAREVCGIDFPNPLGLGGGVDINGEFYNKIADAGFGFVEIGSLTPEPQSKAMPNCGVKEAVKRLRKSRPKAIIGANICINATTSLENAPKDFEKCLARLYDFVDMFIVNVSSPAVEGICTLQDIDRLSEIVDRLIEMRTYFDLYRPIFIKISPDLTHQQIDDIVGYCMRSGIDGIVACNLGKEDSRTGERNAFERNLETVRYIHEATGGLLPIIGSGGIRTPQQAREMMEAGASLVEVCTAFVTRGPSLVRRILSHLDKAQQEKNAQ